MNFVGKERKGEERKRKTEKEGKNRKVETGGKIFDCQTERIPTQSTADVRGFESPRYCFANKGKTFSTRKKNQNNLSV